MPTHQTESRKALLELSDFLRDVDERYVDAARGFETPQQVSEAHRAIMHMLQGGLVSWFEDDPIHPRFKRIVSPSRKFTGDNPDAVYFDCAISPDQTYRVTGNMAGAQYVSITIETATEQGGFSAGLAGVLNDEHFDVDASGHFEIFLGGEERERNWLALAANASRITTRHYIEAERCSAADPNIAIPMSIENLSGAPPTPPMQDSDVAAGIRRVINFVAARTTNMPAPSERPMPPFVSTEPNSFVDPVKPGDFSFAAFDAAYTQAPFRVEPDEALVMTGRWPTCRAGTVCLWTRNLQSFDYANRNVSLNRAQTQLAADGSFRMVVAHVDPGVPNWIDCEGRTEGTIFWRFMLPEGEIETPRAELVKLADL